MIGRKCHTSRGGGVTGAIAGTVLSKMRSKVVSYVDSQPLPAEGVMVDGDVAVGTRLPPDVALVEVPEDPQYAYGVVNRHRVIVDPKTYSAGHFHKNMQH